VSVYALEYCSMETTVRSILAILLASRLMYELPPQRKNTKMMHRRPRRRACPWSVCADR
jgi:hypothetical protein